MVKQKILNFSILLVCIFPGCFCFSQGLLFHANDELISKRTSYSVFQKNKPVFKDFFHFSFDFTLSNSNYFGYICFIGNISDKKKYALSLSNEDNITYIKFNIAGERCLLQIPMNKKMLGYRRWQHLELLFDAKNRKITLTLNEKKFSIPNQDINEKIAPEIIFGKYDSYVDVPKIAIRNISVGNSHNNIVFLLNENEGNDVYDRTGKIYGFVANPGWLINDSYNWKFRGEKKLKKPGIVNFDIHNQQFIILNHDSAFTLDIQDNTFRTRKYNNNNFPVEIRLGNSFIDDKQQKLFVYEVNNLPIGSISVSSLNLTNFNWEKVGSSQLLQQRHHHSSFYNADEKKYTIFGGFGNQHYSNDFYTYSTDSDVWIKEQFSGDRIHPRFYSGQASLNQTQALLFGGIGNETGDQTVGRTYSYDCYKIDYKKKTIKKLWEIPLSTTGLVTVRNMILAEDGKSFYTLCYPEYIPSTYIRLYKFTIKDGTYQILGDSIPFTSERIESNANLYYNKQTGELYCTTQVFAPDGASTIKIYSLVSPPVSISDIGKMHKKSILFSILTKCFLFVIFSIISILIFLRRKKQKSIKQISEYILPEFIEPKPDLVQSNGIYLFGEFTITDRDSKNISYLFSPKVKQLFLYILFKGIENGQGVNSQDIHSAIWPEKTPDNAKNLKGVILNLIRKILVDMDGIELTYKNGHFNLDITENCHIDFIHFIDEIDIITKTPNEDNIDRLLKITSRGPFLKSIDFVPIIRIRHDIARKIKLSLMPIITNCFKEHNYSSIIKLINSLSQLEPYDEDLFRFEIEAYLKAGFTEQARKRYNIVLNNFSDETHNHFPPLFDEYVEDRKFRIK